MAPGRQVRGGFPRHSPLAASTDSMADHLRGGSAFRLRFRHAARAAEAADFLTRRFMARICLLNKKDCMGANLSLTAVSIR